VSIVRTDTEGLAEHGQRLQVTNNTSFFAVQDGGMNYPQGNLVDRRILYDPDAERWVASMIDYGATSYNIILAVSKTNNPLDLLTNWNKYLIRVTRPNDDSDYDTMGMDQNGIYLSVLHRDVAEHTNDGLTVVAIKKADIYNGTNRYTLLTNHPGLSTWCIQPAVNFDTVTSNGYAWFVAKGPPEYGTQSGTNYYGGGAVYYRRLQWLGTNADWVETNWVSVPSPQPDYRDYYDFDGTNISTSTQAGGLGAPQLGGTNRIALKYVGSRLMMAVIRNGFLWTCQHVGLTGTNGVYLGDQTGASVDRSAAQWLKLQIGTSGTGLTHREHGRIFDPSRTNSYWYYFPSLMVNCSGDMVAGFSGSSQSNYVGAFFASRLTGCSVSAGPRLIHAGAGYYNSDRWGDYSRTCVDPTDDWKFWTVQEYALPILDSYQWATWIAGIRPTP